MGIEQGAAALKGPRHTPWPTSESLPQPDSAPELYARFPFVTVPSDATFQN
jgi:hypothetical protein